MTKDEDAEFEETSEHYEAFETTEYDPKKQIKIDSMDLNDGGDEETDDHFSDDQQMHANQDINDDSVHLQQQQQQQHVTLQNASVSAAEQQRQSDQHQQQHMTQSDERLIIPYHEIHQQQHHQATVGNGNDSVISPTSSSTEIIRLIHPSHAQATSVTTSDGQTVYMTTPTSSQQQQQLISIAGHPVSLARFTHPHIEAHMSVVDSTGVSSNHNSIVNNSNASNNASAVSAGTVSVLSAPHKVEGQMSPPLHQHQQHQLPTSIISTAVVQGTVSGGGGGNNSHDNKQAVVSASAQATTTSGNNNHVSSGRNGLSYFLLDIQMQMEKLNDIAQMELKVEMQKLLLDKLRQADNYKLLGN